MGKEREINPLQALKNCRVDSKGRCFRFGFSSKESPRIIPITPFKSAKEYKRKKLKMAIKALKKEYRERCKIELININ
jgi:hypothetical protein